MDPEIRLDPLECRALGVLVEKALTTPEQYPLSLNAVVLGANQKVNRDPVLALEEPEVELALDGLIDKELARKVFPGASRVDKYCHTGKSTLKVEVVELAVIAELLLRGPQTAAEIRSRASRMVPIESTEQLATILDTLRQRGFIERLAPHHGSRAERWVQLLCPDLHPLEAESAAAEPRATVAAHVSSLPSRVEALESEVATLRRQLHDLAAKLGEPLE
jgi:uncharacterized protein